jgi:hypothetical protein
MMLLVSCGHGDDECLALAQQYANEIHDVAIHCDPSAGNPCGVKLEGLASNCTHAVKSKLHREWTANFQRIHRARVPGDPHLSAPRQRMH